MSRRELAQLTNLTEASLSRIARDLIDRGIVKEADPPVKAAQRGRPNVRLVLNPGSRYVIAACLSTYEHKLSFVSITGERLWECEIPHAALASSEELQLCIASKHDEAKAGPEFRLKQPLGIAFALSDTDEPAYRLLGTTSHSIFLGDTQLPVYATTISSAIHATEVHNTHGEVLNSLLIHCGVEFGASLIIDGNLRSHASDIDCSGRIAVIANRQTGAVLNSLATAASGRSILERLGSGSVTADGIGLQSGMPHAIRQANSGDPKAVMAFEQAGLLVGQSYVAVATLLALHQIVLAGPLASAKPFLNGFRRLFDHTFNDLHDVCPHIRRSTISDLKATEHIALNRFVFDNEIGFRG